MLVTQRSYKKREMFRLFITLIITFGNMSSYATDLEEAIKMAIKNSSKIKSQFYQYKSAEKQLKSSGVTGFLPDISLRYTFDSSLNIIDDMSDSGKSLTLRQKIIDGGAAFATFRQSNHLLRAAKIRFQQSKQEVALSAVKAYVNVLQKLEILKLVEREERVSSERLLAARRRFSLAEVTNAEVLFAKAKFLSSVSKRVDAEGQLKLASVVYRYLIGEAPDNLRENNVKLPSIPELNECLRLAKVNNLSLKEAFYRKRAAGIEVIVESSKWLPSLDLSISKSFGKGDLKLDSLLENVNVAFALDVPLFKRGVNVFGVGRAKMDAKQSTYDYYEEAKNMEQAVINAWNNVLTAKAFIEASQEAEKAAALALERIQQEVNLNLKSTTDLLNIEDELFKARSNLIQAKFDHVIGVYNLLFVLNGIEL